MYGGRLGGIHRLTGIACTPARAPSAGVCSIRNCVTIACAGHRESARPGDDAEARRRDWGSASGQVRAAIACFNRGEHPLAANQFKTVRLAPWRTVDARSALSESPRQV